MGIVVLPVADRRPFGVPGPSGDDGRGPPPTGVPRRTRSRPPCRTKDPPMPRRTVLLLTSPDLGWSGLGAILGAMGDVRVLGQTPCPDHGRRLAAAQRPDVVFCPTWLGGGPAPRILLDLQRGPCPESRIAFVSRGIGPDDIAATAGLRYQAWLLWPEVPPGELPDLARTIVFTTARVATPTPAAMLLGLRPRADADHGRPATDHPPPLALSPREREVLALLARDGEARLTVKEIARLLGVKDATVQTNIERVAAKLHLSHGGRRAVVDAARRRGMIG